MNTTPTSLTCPTCGAPLDADGTRTIVRCKFCGNASLLPDAKTTRTTAQASALDEIRRLIRNGNLSEAIEYYRRAYGVDLSEAKDAIDALRAGRLVTASAQGSHTSEELTQALQTVQRLLSDGKKIEAIKIYREYYDVSLARAKYAVDQIQAGNTLWPEAGFQAPSIPSPEGHARRGIKWLGWGITAGIILFVGGIIFAALSTPGGPLNPHYFPVGKMIMIESSSVTVESVPPDFAALLYDSGKDIRFIGLVDGTTGKLRWKTEKLSGNGFPNAIESNADVVITANDTDLLANRLMDGSLIWQAQMPDRLNYGDITLLVTAGLVITDNADQSLQAYDVETGELVWSRRLTGYDRDLRLIGQYLVVVDYIDDSYDYVLMLLDPVTGNPQRVIQITCKHQDYSYNAVDTESGLVYDEAANALFIVSDGSYGCITRLDLSSGQLVWQASVDDSFSFLPNGFQSLLTETNLYFSTGNDIMSVDKSDGTTAVLLTNPDYDLLPLAAAGDKMIVLTRRTRGTERFELWGVNPTSGERLWQIDMQEAEPIDPPYEMVGLVDDIDWGWTWKLTSSGMAVIKFRGEPNQIILETFNPADGTSLGEQTIKLARVSGDFYSIPQVIGWQDDTAYFSVESNLYALDIGTGKLKVIY
jgi:outer membrane protein assembly factor BamB/ribosomal protein L7/L12